MAKGQILYEKFKEALLKVSESRSPENLQELAVALNRLTQIRMIDNPVNLAIQDIIDQFGRPTWRNCWITSEDGLHSLDSGFERWHVISFDVDGNILPSAEEQALLLEAVGAVKNPHSHLSF